MPASLFSPTHINLATLALLRGSYATWPGQGITHLLVVIAEHNLKSLPSALPGREVLLDGLRRVRDAPASLGERPHQSLLPDGIMCAWVWLNPQLPMFEQHQLLAKAYKGLLAESPSTLGVSLRGERACAVAAEVAYVGWVNGAHLPQQKKDAKPGLQRLLLAGCNLEDPSVETARVVAYANVLARSLTVLPPNILTPTLYRQYLRALSEQQRWMMTEFDEPRLASLGAGAFLAVAQGSPQRDAAIVRLRYRGVGARQRVALVGKGICFDTGGHNLKPARHMYNMHEDMNGSAVALAILWAVTQLRLPLHLECWLALAQNHIGPSSYRQNDVVHALNGTTIEVVHTDAEGRMVLADTLALAVRAHPDLMIDFATLTGSMQTALGTRHSGLFSNREVLTRLALGVSDAAGERLVAFPMTQDYDQALESKVADLKQCTPESEADHILAARFLQRFAGAVPWLHLDLSAARSEEGLGAVLTPVTGFGVNWGVRFLDSWLRSRLQS